MTRTLYILRHAKSDWGNPGAEDFDRGLAPRGRSAAPRMGASMLKAGYRPDLVLCSSAIRARATLALLLPELKLPEPPEIRYEDDLYLASPEALLERLHSVPDAAKRVLIIGHNPGLHALALALAGRGGSQDMAALATKFPTAALAVLSFDVPAWPKVRAGTGRLEAFLTPRKIKD